MFGKKRVLLPSIGKSTRRALFPFCQTLAKSGRICQALAKPFVARGGRAW
jgi:hypothetical protein